MTLDELEGASTRRDFIDISGTNEENPFTHRQPFGIHLRYKNQLEGHNNWRHAPIYLDRTWATKFWPDRNFAWYLAVLEVNTDLVSGQSIKDGVLQPSLDFWRALEIEYLDNII